LAGQAALFCGLRQLQPPALSRGFAHRVMNGLDKQSLKPETKLASSARPWSLALAVLSAAALLLLAVVVGLQYRGDQRLPLEIVQPASQVESDKRASRDQLATVPTAGGTPAVQSDLPEGRQGEAPRSLRQGPGLESIQEYGQAIGSLAAQLPDRLDDVEEATPGMRPVRHSFSLAIGTIRRTIPPPRKQDPPPRPAKQDSGMTRAALWAVVSLQFTNCRSLRVAIRHPLPTLRHPCAVSQNPLSRTNSRIYTFFPIGPFFAIGKPIFSLECSPLVCLRPSRVL
jgi:hypothetical protein